MKLISYLPLENRVAERLQEVLEATVLTDEIEIYRTIESLAGRLRQPGTDQMIAVLLAAAGKDLSDILSIRELFEDIKIILILPDGERSTISGGHKLYPRFVCCADSDFSDVAAVLGKMLENSNFSKGSKGNKKTR
ncbi:MAG: hypothetical protein GY846_10765 [Deltaproteobacteria bacterium]|nr:hypothetical protein [Deltaproteobacteria bacterium]